MTSLGMGGVNRDGQVKMASHEKTMCLGMLYSGIFMCWWQN